ncbi:11116_t:CDS:2 [Diversispora eburnea]|uniref:11116_t:CDS:1 n=1 Tax=Diversispora eburnea TaxID=1213867 RepID=A0A9N9FLQ0_9GLOM|nr:11116_t:CDS:2 [Diversispora eburnea]
MKNKAFSEILGYVSIISFLVFFVPQYYEDYKRKSSASISLSLLFLWAIADVFNLIGSILQDLIPTVILLAIFYNIAGILLIIQVLYYRYREIPSEIINDNNESAGKSETSYQIKQNSTSTTSSTFSRHKQFFVILVGTFCVFFIGISLSRISALSFENINNDNEQFKFLPQLLGWFSTIFYLGSRIPQIIKNYRLKSTKDRDYLLTNLPWLCGNGGTIFFDFVLCFKCRSFVYIDRNHAHKDFRHDASSSIVPFS